MSIKFDESKETKAFISYDLEYKMCEDWFNKYKKYHGSVIIPQNSPFSFTSFQNRNKANLEYTMDFNTKETDIMKEIKAQKIVDLYFSKKRKEHFNSFDKAEEEILNKDPLYSSIKDKVKEINTLIVKHGHDEIKLNLKQYTDETTDKLLEHLAKESLDEQEALSDKIFEIKSMLSACDTYEQEMKVLETYGVVEDGKLNV